MNGHLQEDFVVFICEEAHSSELGEENRKVHLD